MPKRGEYLDLSGQRFGKWVALRFHRWGKNGIVFFWCCCDCGNEKEVAAYALKGGRSLSCACRGTANDRFDRFVIRPADPDACWQWTGHLCHGYGTIRVNGRRVKAHVFSYRRYVGEIPKGLQPDHLCRKRSCVNPRHLEPVTGRVNVLRGVGFAAVNAAKTHCIRGHELQGANVKMYGRSRHCLACKRFHSQKRTSKAHQMA